MPKTNHKPRRNNLDQFLMLRIDEETRRQLDELAYASERTASAYIRWMIKQAYQEMVAADAVK